eukprot:CAMPEP_0181297050 /NCGR_PEP_ID=MMETSP1101-20121128/5030_1 /TAXON_ID=46948 /ORGANISM="Rhodomonas abbreviata, Strain Caron Lab Isolate" /LENGTH=208 /DNA_ID=CAMNT_0023401955 /DNA_START=156 /DNA_END=780 /DNA_ORIENTATION=-
MAALFVCSSTGSRRSALEPSIGDPVSSKPLASPRANRLPTPSNTPSSLLKLGCDGSIVRLLQHGQPPVGACQAAPAFHLESKIGPETGSEDSPSRRCRILSRFATIVGIAAEKDSFDFHRATKQCEVSPVRNSCAERHPSKDVISGKAPVQSVSHSSLTPGLRLNLTTFMCSAAVASMDKPHTATRLAAVPMAPARGDIERGAKADAA